MAIGLNATAYGQCPEPWYSANTVYRTINAQGSGTASVDGVTQTTNQSITFALNLLGYYPGTCSWSAWPGTGTAANRASINDVVVGAGGVCTTTAQADGSGSPLVALAISGTNTYSFNATDNLDGKVIYTGDPLSCNPRTQDETIGWGPGGLPGPTPQFFPWPSSASMSGNFTFSAIPGDNISFLPANWTVTWNFSPAPDDTCKDCNDNRGSRIGCRSQSLGEDIPVVGTPFFLHYESARAFGRAGADADAAADARSLGGWRLSAHHVLERLLQLWCIGGGCTPYATTPKALFLGNGQTRDDASVQSAVSYNGNLYLTSEDGSEIYVFNNYVHTQTVRPMTGAVIYTFGYDGNAQLITVTDAVGNVTTIQRDANENATAIVSPYGQTTTLAVDANGYLSQVTDPAGNIVKLSSGATGLLASLTDANGNVHNFQYDIYGRLTNDSDPAGGSISTARTDSSSGYSTTKTTALGVSSSYAVTFNSTTSSSAQKFTNTWPSGLQATETDTQQLGQASESMVLPDGTSTTTTNGPDPRWGIQVPFGTSQTVTLGNLTMNAVGGRNATLGTPGNPFSLTVQTDTRTVNGRSYTSAFTASDRTYLNTSPVGRTLTVTLDSLERLASTQAGKLLPTNLTYDSRGRLAATTQGTRTTTFSYDTNGFLASIVDPLKRTTSFTHDAAGNLLTSTLPDGRVINYAYDANGNLTSLTPPGKSANDFAYTAVNLRSSYTPPSVAGTGATAYAHDADRDLTTITRPDGETIQFNYDNAGGLSATVAPTETIDYSYSLTTGTLASAAVNGGEQIAYSYNGSLPTASTWTGPVPGSVSRRYDNNFWITSVSINGRNSVGFQNDNDGLVTKAGALVLKRSASDGLITGTTLGPARDSRSYDPFGELSNYAASYNGVPLYCTL